MKLSANEIHNMFQVPHGINVARASYLKATKSKGFPRSEIVFVMVKEAEKLKSNKNLPIGCDASMFQTVVSDLIHSLKPTDSNIESKG